MKIFLNVINLQTYIVEYGNYAELADFVAVKDELKITILEGIVLL